MSDSERRSYRRREVEAIYGASRHAVDRAVQLGLMPKTMAGKKYLKKLVFGNLVEMPAEITEQHVGSFVPPENLDIKKNTTHKVVYCAATKQG